MLGKGCNLENFHNAWVELWSLEVSPNVLHFLWKLCTSILPTRALLFHRHLIEMVDCPWGYGDPESAHHAIFQCPRFDEVWRESGCSIMRDDSGCANMCDPVVKWRTLDKMMRIKGVFLMWCIWGERNNKIFNAKTTPNHLLLDRASRLAEEYGKYTEVIYHRGVTVVPSAHTWRPPPAPNLKINVDASLAVEG
ncbi:uncharacterized protein LOC125496651 [Beta vulgaris subsp. vulgaris]|uniref:uncharacterized protein LOC125496651 n=1 Tax=Beta vulgaris subsp. vulgaris TaxID=3555 RepID=UPI002036C9A9|nr:uncharacterized protein LOC125496651 [Beta vulgaris subsp. vulgaris]